MSRRTIALVLAVILAAGATVALVSYVQGERDKALGEGEAVAVFVAKEAIPAGTDAETAIQRGLIDQTTIPRRVVAQGAVGSLDEIRGKVASIDVLPGDQIVSARWVTPAEARSSSGLISIPRNRVAMAVEVGIVPGVANFIQPGDRVSVLAQLAVPRGGASETRVQFVLQDIEVLQVGRRVVLPQEQGGAQVQQAQDKVTLTLAVTLTQAERLGFATLQGQLYFTLLPPGGRPGNTGGRTARNTFPG